MNSDTTTRTRPDTCPRCGENPEDWATTPNGVCDGCMDEINACLNFETGHWARLEYVLELRAHTNFYKK